MSFDLSHNEENKSPLSEQLDDEGVGVLIVNDEEDIFKSFRSLLLTNSCTCRRIFLLKISNCLNCGCTTVII